MIEISFGQILTALGFLVLVIGIAAEVRIGFALTAVRKEMTDTREKDRGEILKRVDEARKEREESIDKLRIEARAMLIEQHAKIDKANEAIKKGFDALDSSVSDIQAKVALHEFRLAQLENMRKH